MTDYLELLLPDEEHVEEKLGLVLRRVTIGPPVKSAAGDESGGDETLQEGPVEDIESLNGVETLLPRMMSRAGRWDTAFAAAQPGEIGLPRWTHTGAPRTQGTAQVLYSQLRAAQQAAGYTGRASAGGLTAAEPEIAAPVKIQAAQLDKIFQRDARRYNAGFSLY